MQNNYLKKITLGLLVIIFSFLLIYSVYKLIVWQLETQRAQEQADSLKTASGEINFGALREINSDTIAWIKVPGTKIDYPVVQAKDNSYYLNRTFDKKPNQAGWIFADYRNNFKEFDQNTIIYGHGLLNGIMFGTLKDTLKEPWYHQPSNHQIKLLTDKKNTVWQVFSTYKIDVTNDYLDINFDDPVNYLEFLSKLKTRSAYNYNVELTSTDKIITLSTCGNKQDRIVLHAKLISTKNRKSVIK